MVGDEGSCPCGTGKRAVSEVRCGVNRPSYRRLPMGFRDQADVSLFNLVKVNHHSGKREVLVDRGLIEGRWAADAAVKQALEQNRDPAISFEVQASGEMRKKFRAAAFGDATE